MKRPMLVAILLFLCLRSVQAQPGFSLSASGIAFGDVTAGMSKVDSVVVTNTGNAPLTIAAIISDNSEFSVSPSSGSIAASASQTFRIAYSPVVIGAAAAHITFLHNAASSPDTLDAGGAGVMPVFEFLPSLSFGDVLVGGARLDSVVVENTGSQALMIDTVRSDNPEFEVSPGSAFVLPSESRTFMVSFHPATSGLKPAHIVFIHSATSSPDTVFATGRGVAPEFSVSPASLSFGSVGLGLSRQDSLTVTNIGTSPLSITSVTADSGILTVLPAGATIGPAGSQTFQVFFKPAAVGVQTGSIIFVHDGSSSPDSVPAGGRGTSTLTIRKFRDADGVPSTLGDQTPKRWHLSVYRDSVSAAGLIAEADTSEISIPVLEAGTYIACEADSGAEWRRVNGNGTPNDTLMITTESRIDSFLNVRVNGICVREYEDGDGLFSTTADRTAKSWYLEIRRYAADGPIMASGHASSISASDLGDGDYYVIEADSSGWVQLGYEQDGTPVAGSSRSVLLTVAGGQTSAVEFVNAPKVYSKRFRSFTAEALSQAAPVKKKPVAARFCAEFVNATGADVDGLRMGIKADGSISVVITVESDGRFPSAVPLNGKTWTFSGATVPAGDTVRICGIGNHAKRVLIESWNWIVNGVPQATQPSFTPPNQEFLLPMPNFADFRNDVFAQNGFGPGGFVVGVARPDSAKRYGWVHIRKSDLLRKALLNRGVAHTAPAHGFDALVSGTAFIKEHRDLTPQKYNNVLFANLAALRFGIAASALGKTPVGFGELIYDDRTSNPLNGMMVKEIAHYADVLMMGYYQAGLHRFESASTFANLNATIQGINAACSGPVDTVSWATSLILTGAKRLIDAPMLHANPDVPPVQIAGDEHAPAERGAPAEFRLDQNYPNPFNPVTVIRFSAPSGSLVTLKVYNLLGEEVAALLQAEPVEEGEQEVEFDAARFPSGVYFYRLQSAPLVAAENDDEGNPTPSSRRQQAFVSVRKMLLVK